MKSLPLLLGLAVVAASPCFAARAKPARGAEPEVPASTGPTLETFRIITERNIFSTFRSGRAERTTEEPRGESIAFVGTMTSEQGTFAFFDGSDSAYRQVLRVGQAVGPFKVARISDDRVELEREGRVVTIRVTQQMRRPVDGDWQVAGPEVARDLNPAGASPGGSDNRIPAPIPANASETLRRLMEQRQKQLKQ